MLILLGLLRCVAVGDNADASKVNVVSIFRVEVDHKLEAACTSETSISPRDTQRNNPTSESISTMYVIINEV
jgi:hypothetical protein